MVEWLSDLLSLATYLFMPEMKGNTDVPSYDIEWDRPEPTEDWDAGKTIFNLFERQP
jgi:hypothetical protein